MLCLEIGLFNKSGEGIGIIASLVLDGDNFWDVLDRDDGMGVGGDVLGLIDCNDGIGVGSFWDFSEIIDCDDEMGVDGAV